MRQLLTWVFAALLAGAAQASDAPPIALPAAMEGMRTVQPLDEPFNKVVNYESDGEVISLYLFRPTHPNAALWFERAEAILTTLWKERGLGEGGETRRLSVVGSSVPNALARSFSVSGDYKSTGLAVAQIGNWLVKVRSSSRTLDRDAQLARMEQVLATIAAPSGVRPANPLTLPEPCPPAAADATFKMLLNSEAIDKPNPETMLAAGAVLLTGAQQMAGGEGSLAAAPDSYCRAELPGIGPAAALYRRKNDAGGEWTALLADSGTSVSGLKTVIFDRKKTKDGGMITANGLDKTRAVLFAQGIPAPEAGFMPAARLIVAGSKEGYVAVAYGTQNIEVALPK